MRIMAIGWIGLFVLTGLCLALAAFGDGTTTSPAEAAEPGETHVPVTFLGGYDTNPVDRGRPVLLVASALGIPEQTFRDAFKGVHPAPPGRGPTGEEARANKAALMKVLEPLGITNDRLDEVSNHYRYNRSAGELWKHVPAEAYAHQRRQSDRLHHHQARCRLQFGPRGPRGRLPRRARNGRSFIRQRTRNKRLNQRNDIAAITLIVTIGR